MPAASVDESGSGAATQREVSPGSSPAVAAQPSLMSQVPAKPDDNPLSPGTAAKRLQTEDDKHELFRYLPETYSLSHRLRRHGWSTLRYLMQTEVHTYAFSVAANSILSFFPFIVLLLTVVQRVFHSQAMYNVVLQLLRDYLPSNKDFVIRNLQFLASVKGRGQILSIVMLLITSYRDFSAAGSCAQQHLGLQEEPLVPDEPGGLAGTGAGLRMSGHALHCADG